MGNVGREVWHSEEAWVSIYLENNDGAFVTSPAVGILQTWVATPTLVCKFVQNVSIKNSFTLMVFGQTGAADQDIISIPGPFDVAIGSFFYTAASQWVPFLNSQSRWRVLFQNTNPKYDGVTQLNDSIILRNAAIASPSISWKSNDMQACSLDFKAESRESGGLIVSP
jgi:hypothetical protein